MGDAPTDCVGAELAEELGVATADTETVPDDVGVTVPVREGDTDLEGERLAVPELVEDGVPVIVLVADGVTDEDGVTDAVPEEDEVGLDEGDPDAV